MPLPKKAAKKRKQQIEQFVCEDDLDDLVDEILRERVEAVIEDEAILERLDALIDASPVIRDAVEDETIEAFMQARSEGDTQTQNDILLEIISGHHPDEIERDEDTDDADGDGSYDVPDEPTGGIISRTTERIKRFREKEV